MWLPQTHRGHVAHKPHRSHTIVYFIIIQNHNLSSTKDPKTNITPALGQLRPLKSVQLVFIFSRHDRPPVIQPPRLVLCYFHLKSWLMSCFYGHCGAETAEKVNTNLVDICRSGIWSKSCAKEKKRNKKTSVQATN